MICFSLLFLSQCGGGHRPEGGIFPSGGEWHVHPNGPAGHRTGPITQCAASLSYKLSEKQKCIFSEIYTFLISCPRGVQVGLNTRFNTELKFITCCCNTELFFLQSHKCLLVFFPAVFQDSFIFTCLKTINIINI